MITLLSFLGSNQHFWIGSENQEVFYYLVFMVLFITWFHSTAVSTVIRTWSSEEMEHLYSLLSSILYMLGLEMRWKH